MFNVTRILSLLTLADVLLAPGAQAQDKGAPDKSAITVGIFPRSLDDLDAASINNDYAEQAGLVPARDAIAREAAKSPYANVIAVRRVDQDKLWVKKLVSAYQSDEVREYIDREFKGSLIPAF